MNLLENLAQIIGEPVELKTWIQAGNDEQKLIHLFWDSKKSKRVGSPFDAEIQTSFFPKEILDDRKIDVNNPGEIRYLPFFGPFRACN